jgi:hypothetical protein
MVPIATLVKYLLHFEKSMELLLVKKQQRIFIGYTTLKQWKLREIPETICNIWLPIGRRIVGSPKLR